MLTVGGKAHARKIGEAFAKHGIKPFADLLGLELIGEGELLVARADENGELTVLGKIQVQP